MEATIFEVELHLEKGRKSNLYASPPRWYPKRGLDYQSLRCREQEGDRSPPAVELICIIDSIMQLNLEKGVKIYFVYLFVPQSILCVRVTVCMGYIYIYINTMPRAGFEPTSLAFRASVLPLHNMGSLMSPVCAAPCLRGKCRLLHTHIYIHI